MKTDVFAARHIGIREQDLPHILETIGVSSLAQLIDETIPDSIRLKESLSLAEGISENEFLQELYALAQKNQLYKNYIGLGYHETSTPSVIKRAILENPGWYTAYTPYQAEIAQGRLEALLTYQTMVCDLTGMEIANASLLDESTAAAEAMLMLFNLRSREQQQAGAVSFFVSEEVLPQTFSVLQTRAIPLGIELVKGDHREFKGSTAFFGALLQYPGVYGGIPDYIAFTETAKEKGIKIAVAADILSLVLFIPPGEWGADVVVGSTQRFGIPLGYGGPHAAYFATKEEYKRAVPGRIIGISRDANGNRALRMALQTREQHIKRDKATSNICTAQVLLAVMAGMYAVYHGPEGLRYIARKIHRQAIALAQSLEKIGVKQLHDSFFDTLHFRADAAKVRAIAEAKRVNFFYPDEETVCISLNETNTLADLNNIVGIMAETLGKEPVIVETWEKTGMRLGKWERKTPFLTHEVFNTYHSETELMRYIKKLERRDLSLTHSMISLGSCTMKLNAATEMLPLSWMEWAAIHPFAPIEQAAGYQEVLKKLEEQLKIITGFTGVSLQPNSGAQGEYAGLLVIKAYQEWKGEKNRKICLIPSSAHGTNPASAVMAGMEVVVVKTDERGNIDVNDLREKAIRYREELAALMITYPSTHGVFETAIQEITAIIHENGGQVYMDGANMNAQVGLTNPAIIGADVCHLNLHKTFAIPHGGGGPGVGPICVAAHLAPFLPSHPVVKTGGEKAIPAVSGAPWGSALVCLISYAYNRLLGAKGVTDATKYAILNANYIKSRLEGYYELLYAGAHGRVAHEMIVDCRSFKKKGIEVIDIAKRLMDYGFHAPTVSFPVAGTLMIEPTESESLAELYRFCEAMIAIRKEIDEVSLENPDNVLKNAPHTLQIVAATDWHFSYSREKAAFPLDYLYENKFWPSVRRVDDAFGDRNLLCTCAPIEAYMEEK